MGGTEFTAAVDLSLVLKLAYAYISHYQSAHSKDFEIRFTKYSGFN